MVFSGSTTRAAFELKNRGTIYQLGPEKKLAAK